MKLNENREGWKTKVFMWSLSIHKVLARLKRKDLRLVSLSYPMNISNDDPRRPVLMEYPLTLSDDDPRAATLELMSREIYRYNIEGSTAELGVFRGDFARLINHYFPDRKLYLFDTFEGFDKRDAETDRREKFSPATQDFTQTSVELALSKMEHRENCIIRKGWFPDTAEGVDDKFCFVSLDCDLYQPIRAGLEFFYPRLVHGGVIMLHDFNNMDYQGVREAVKEFCDKNNTGYVCLSDVCGSVAIVK